MAPISGKDNPGIICQPILAEEFQFRILQQHPTVSQVKVSFFYSDFTKNQHFSIIILRKQNKFQQMQNLAKFYCQL